MRFARKLTLIAASFAIAACASTPKAEGSSTTASATQITADEIAAANVPTAYEAVDRLHRSWFRDLSNPDLGEAVVYLNNEKLGGKEKLRDFPAWDVAMIEYLKPADALLRFGQDAKGGAIIVTRK